jgi:hypothetical protein
LNTLSLRFSLNMTDQVSHPYRTTDKIIVIFILLDSKWETTLISGFRRDVDQICALLGYSRHRVAIVYRRFGTMGPHDAV